jgi:hypothetical protein
MALARYQGRGSSNSQASSQTGADIGEIAEQIKAKVKHPTPVNGEVELDVQRIPELHTVSGGERMGPLQGDLQPPPFSRPVSPQVQKKRMLGEH